MREKRKKVISVVALLLIVVLIITATYAYFVAQTDEGSSTDINITTATVDNLTFETGDAISINATQTNFASGLDSLSDDTYVKATLIANNDTNSASANYYVYLNISTNEFEYTTSDSTAELILSITMDGTEVTALNGYDYVSVTDGNSNVISGFDITTASGLITIADNYLIESTGIEVDDWEVTITFVNLDSDQSGNAGKSFSASLIIQSDAQPTLSNYIISLLGIDSNLYFHASDISLDTTGTVNDTDYYCTYDGTEVYNFDNWSTDDVTESSCNIVYKVTDDDYIGYFDDSYTSYITEYGSAVWDSEDSVCKTSDGNEVYTWYYFNTVTEENCSGTVYYQSNYDIYLVGIEYVGSGEWINLSTLGAQDDSYRYSGTDYVLTSAAIDTGYESVDDTSTSTDNGIIDYYCQGNSDYSYIGGERYCHNSSLGYYYLNYDAEQKQYETYYEAIEQAISDGYVETSVNNYVCFGDNCSDKENLYRIIGVFQNGAGEYEVKLIKADYADSTLLGEDGDYYVGDVSGTNYYTYRGYKTTLSRYYWNKTNYSSSNSYNNDWSISQLNTVNLNTNYLNNIGTKWSDMIAEHTWIVGGNTWSNIGNQNVKITYRNEIINPSSEVDSTYSAKIGLIYISDYVYSYSSNYWTDESYDIYDNYYQDSWSSWIYLGVSEWSITRYSGLDSTVFAVSDYDPRKVNSKTLQVRPCFYLNSSVLYIGGSGTSSDPYRVGIS